MGLRRVRQWLQAANGWQRIFLLLTIVSALTLAAGLSVEIVETDAGGNEKVVGSLLCRRGDAFVHCNVSWIVQWIVAVVGLYLSGLAVAWASAGFRRKD